MATARNNTGRIDLNALLMFHAIASTGSLTRAAARLDVSKATLSRRLRDLEREVNALLVTRGHRRLELTEAGAVLFADSQTLAAEAQAVADRVRTLRTEFDGALRIAVPTGFMATVCDKAVLRFAARHPRVRLHVTQADRPIDVTQEPFDVAVHIGAVPNRDVPMRLLARVRRGAYASPAYLKGRPTPLAVADLAANACIALSSQISAGVWSIIERSGRRSARRSLRAIVSDVHLAREMARAGLGIAALPEALCREDVESGRLVRVLTEWRIPVAEVFATYADRHYMPSKIRTFLDLLRTEFDDLIADGRGKKRPLRSVAKLKP